MSGVLGRVLSGLSYVVIVIGSLQAGGAFALMPPKVSSALLIIAATITVFSERVSGGASKVNVSQARENEAEGTAKP